MKKTTLTKKKSVPRTTSQTHEKKRANQTKVEKDVTPNIPSKKGPSKRPKAIVLKDEDFYSEPIDLEDAALDISKLLTHSQLQDLPEHAVGGAFCVNQFFPVDETDKKQGVLMWYCINKEMSNPAAQLFLSIEPMVRSSVTSRLRPKNPLQYPSVSFPYPRIDRSQETVKKYLQDIESIPDCRSGGISFPSLHEPHVKRFRACLKEPRRKNPQGDPYNETDWAYFQNYDDKSGDAALTKLITQEDVQYIRYYFGYNEGKTGRNAIRIILFAVNSKGKNLTQYIIQKSIPPAHRSRKPVPPVKNKSSIRSGSPKGNSK